MGLQHRIRLEQRGAEDLDCQSRLEDFRKDEYCTAVMDRAAEVVWGNRHLSREGLAELFASSGFQRSEFHAIQPPGQPSPRLVALAFG